jgi:hypothetical protein
LASISKMVSVAALCGAVLLMAFTTTSFGSGEDDVVHGVAMVHHSDPGGIPRGSDPEKMLASYYGRTLEGNLMANGHSSTRTPTRPPTRPCPSARSSR